LVANAGPIPAWEAEKEAAGPIIGFAHNPETTAMIENPVESWHQIVVTQNPSALSDLLAEDAIFYSPIAYAPQRGRELVSGYLSAALQVFFNPSFRCVRKIVGARDGLFEFEVEIDGIFVNAVDLLKWDDSGKIVEFKVLVRPLKAMEVAQRRMADVLNARQERAIKTGSHISGPGE
jgi:SnoaL-like domain